MTEKRQITQLKYKAQYKPNQLFYGHGQIAVITGWTLKDSVKKHLYDHEYAVIGQLYSPTRGINYLVRNLLANPHVRYLVVLDATKEDRNSGACQCLVDFFEHGFEEGKCDTGRVCWKIKSRIDGYVDQEVKADHLNLLRASVECSRVENISDAVSLVRFYNQKAHLEPWGSPIEDIEMLTVLPNILPGQRYGHRVEGKTIAEAWVKIIHLIKTTGTIRPTVHDGKWQELINLMAIVTDEYSDDPPTFYFPEPNYLPIDSNFLQEYISQIKDDVNIESPQEGVKYTYGQRLHSHFGVNQVAQVIDKLIADIDSARAVMSLWDVTKDNNNNPPCLNHIWVRVVDQELSLTATFRSNDMFSAWPANAMGLRALQRFICDTINQRTKYQLTMGPLITISQSAHIYDDCWESAERVIESQYKNICKQRNYADPVGSFVIYLEGSSIIVEHMTAGSGEVVGCYTGKIAKQIYQQIAADCPGLDVEHAMYLGTELQKAELALSKQEYFIYEQDKPLKNINNKS